MAPGMPERVPFSICAAGGLFFAGGGFVLGLLFFEAGFVFTHKRAKLRIIILFAVERVVQGAFRMLFRHRAFSL
jgi:hypothetical protein